ncbi:Gfo/Idh/MocA family protein [Tuwongella immobilis]|uniref:Gfo/Idh/MocA-like oxidoreductase N-terminal domain-containing protein n=1 Tax=Tuwongella immobilis TaxID=692036 RepID=A0A6C2YME0_9BACT|nr:Gfo/Idh/MocA family oxidoreductase [Tuwongella immobilis]VIP02760.1 oxidoreductase : Oxidoreductase domain protein OS=bacterium UASB270 GN=U27_06187 PE=4 SV=1: GFO_IDH_MocA [Tuwongella immobilis]VTS02369.1 oxidoreductase : Oxidoreductase domain protein OS=bacterium UASB270 GN=U27_06187 PE=4 SV=1: GFO_IDH_MocA [Tuwongella immobilis]
MAITKDTIGVGFIGAGDISILHARAVVKCPGANLVGLWNRSQERAVQRADEFGCKNYPTPEALVADPDIDVVFVLTNLESHLEYTLLALNAGKHVLVEKPVGCSVAEIQQMKDLADSKGLVVLPGHNYIYEASMMRTRELVHTGELGKIVSAYVMYNIHHPEHVAARYPGVVRQILTHHSYILLYLVGKPVELCAMKATLHYNEIPQEDIAMVQMRLENGALAHFCASFAADDHAADPWTVMVKVIGTAGSTRYSYRDHVEIKPGLVHSQTYSAYQGSVMNEVRYFLLDCLRHGEKPLSTLDDAITAQKMIEAAVKSIAESTVVRM